MNHLINVSKGHIPNLGPLGPFLHVERFVVGRWWSRPILVLSLSLKLNKNLGSNTLLCPKNFVSEKKNLGPENFGS